MRGRAGKRGRRDPTPAEDRWGLGVKGGPKTSLGKPRHAWRKRQCSHPKLKQLIDSVTEGMGGGVSESVCSDNLEQQDNPLFVVLALQGKVLVALTKWHRKK